MFSKRNTSGKHLICDIKNIKNTNSLNNVDDLINLLKNICSQHNFDILKEVSYQFEPIGCSILFLLSESHISIHTFPEKNHMSLDLYTCREYDNNDAYNEIFNYIIDYLNASSNESTFQIIDRFF
jgi:S-adenosylmethionine decarboxylase